MKLKLCVITYFIFTFANADFPRMADAWRAYANQDYIQSLQQLYRVRSIAQERVLAETFYLEGLLAYRLGYSLRLAAIYQTYEVQFMHKLSSLPNNIKKDVCLYWVRLSSLLADVYKSMLVVQSVELFQSLSSTESALRTPSGSGAYTWPLILATEKEVQEVWLDELGADTIITISEKKEKGESLTPEIIFVRLSDAVSRSLVFYEQKILEKDFFYNRLRLLFLDYKLDRGEGGEEFLVVSQKAYLKLYGESRFSMLQSLIQLRLSRINSKLKTLRAMSFKKSVTAVTSQNYKTDQPNIEHVIVLGMIETKPIRKEAVRQGVSSFFSADPVPYIPGAGPESWNEKIAESIHDKKISD
ncbi:MAG: hypothetical protein HYS98_03240 [Deltaproteobacteria bacterium]|nr:hypothetical protein [Deltaproteobacteria bacterium]